MVTGQSDSEAESYPQDPCLVCGPQCAGPALTWNLPVIQTSRGRKLLSLLGLLNTEQTSESLEENPPPSHLSNQKWSHVPSLKLLKVVGPRRLAQTKQDVPLVLGTGGHSDLESHGGGQGTCSPEGCASTEEEGRDGQEGSRSVCSPVATLS